MLVELARQASAQHMSTGPTLPCWTTSISEPRPGWPTIACTAQVFEQGSLYSPSALDIKQDDLMSAVQSAIANVAAASLQLNYPTLASIPHSIVNGYKNVLAVSVATEFTFPLAEKVCALLPHKTQRRVCACMHPGLHPPQHHHWLQECAGVVCGH